MTKIEWARDSANAASGCSEARLLDGSMSPECLHCYARLMSARCEALGHEIYEGVTERKGNTARWTGVFRWDRELLVKRFEQMRSGRVFFGSMTDLWHPSHDDGLRAALAEQIVLLGKREEKKRPKVVTLTKRAPELWAWQSEFFPDGLPPRHWAGVTAGSQASADERIPVLLRVKTNGPRVVSVEPLLEEVWLKPWLGNVSDVFDTDSATGIGWVIVGGESGSKARPMNPKWARDLRDQCVVAKVPFFFKQWGEWRSYASGDFASREEWCAREAILQEADIQQHRWDDSRISYLVGKESAGRLLDGREWNEVPNE